MTYRDSFLPAEHGLSPRELKGLQARLGKHIKQVLDELSITTIPAPALTNIYLPLAALLAKTARAQAAPLIVGVNGAQGSGKTTLCQLLTLILKQGFDLRVATLSIDDLYFTQNERQQLAGSVHPLLATRGVPGTHDVAMGLQLLEDLTNSPAGTRLALPVFDKANDDRAPRSAWRQVTAPVDLVLFEGWCVGAIPQDQQKLRTPVNRLEEQEDRDTVWRGYVNTQLADGYARLFARLNMLLMLEVPGMQSVFAWRSLQEKKLAAQAAHRKPEKIMDESALQRFIMHYERLTRHMLAEMPARADLVLRLDTTHQVAAVKMNQSKQF